MEFEGVLNPTVREEPAAVTERGQFGKLDGLYPRPTEVEPPPAALPRGGYGHAEQTKALRGWAMNRHSPACSLSPTSIQPTAQRPTGSICEKQSY